MRQCVNRVRLMENGTAPLVGMRRQATKAISTNHNARQVATIRVHTTTPRPLVSSRLDARSNIREPPQQALGKIIPPRKE